MEEKDGTARTRLTSPEALNGYIRVTSRRVWLVLAVSLALLLAAGAWGILGTVEAHDPLTGEARLMHPIEFVID